MKHNELIGLLLSLALLPSCRKEVAPAPAPAFCELRLVAAAPATRMSGGGTDEACVDDLQVLLFDENGALETSARAGSASLSLTCRSGEKTVWAFVNAPAVSGIARLDDLSALVSRLSDNAPGRLVMGGSRPLTVCGNGTDTVTVERLCAKITLDRITRAFASPVLQARPMTVNRIYLTNVAADRPLCTDGAPAAWLNKLGNQGDCPALLCDEVGKALTDVLSETHTFYVYPNPSTSAARGGTWSPRHTRLVIDTTLDGARSYYVIDIPDILGNHVYRLTDIVLGRPGAADEENVSAEAAVRFSCSVAGWRETDPYQENL